MRIFPLDTKLASFHTNYFDITLFDGKLQNAFHSGSETADLERFSKGVPSEMNFCIGSLILAPITFALKPN
ncbi:hypothetical protein CEXT_48011 [Caerostris extrusa]|uniref:Uncharacterized protein n=1 Tax=Caerostris extrusa TaxID=172846 RepID=A0AAV4MYS0_CAEEX|nr:hypothetical protein CEXT_48011 [Caerostris extrusa]